MADFSLEDLGVVEKSDLLPPGRYTAELRAIEPINTARGRSLKFRFEVVGTSKYEGVTVTGLNTTRLKLGNKLCKWIEALRGEAVKPSEKIIWDDLNGSRAVILVDHSTKEHKNEAVFANVIAVYPMDVPAPLTESAVE